VLAVREGRDDLAKQALIRQQEHAERALAYEDQWHKLSAETERLKDSLRQLNEKIEEAKRKKNLLVAKQKRAQAQRRIHETMAGLTDRSAFETFDRMAEKIEDSERRALAAAEVTESLQGDTLEKEFAQLKPATDGVEFKLLQLKERMGMLSAGAKGETALPGSGNSEAKRLNAGEDSDPVRDAELEEEA
jgi:phage shock protein A